MRRTGEIEVIARAVCARGGRLLLCRTKGARHTYLPGGHVEFGEPAAAALERELREELGVAARATRFLGVVEHKFVQKGTLHHELNFVFEARMPSLDPRRNPVSQENYIEFEWIELAGLAGSDLEPAPLRRLVPAWMKGRSVRRWAGTF